MAEVMLRHTLQQRDCSGVEVASTGTWAYAGQPATQVAIDTLTGRGIDLSKHQSRPLVEEEVSGADLVIGMTSVHQREVLALVPSVASKFRLIKELPELRVPKPDGTSMEERLAALLAAPRPAPRRALDVDDPMGLPVSAYERTYSELQAGIDALVDRLCPPPPSGK
jgi:protein-tyrosine-phosphatase